MTVFRSSEEAVGEEAHHLYLGIDFRGLWARDRAEPRRDGPVLQIGK